MVWIMIQRKTLFLLPQLSTTHQLSPRLSLAKKVWFTRLTSANDALEIFSTVTCALSIIGSLAIILSYIFIREIRSKARELLVHLSIMNLIYTTVNFVGLIVPYDKCLFHRQGREHCDFKRLCEAQAFLGAYGTAGSILWTLGLSVYLFFRTAVTHNHRLTKGVVIVLYVVCYLLPLYPSLWLLLGGHLGYPQSAHEGGGWCTILIESDNQNASKYDRDMPLITADGHGLWMWVLFIIMLLIYSMLHCAMRAAKGRFKSRRILRSHFAELDNRRLLSSRDPRLISLKINQKFLLVPIAFIGLRIWNIIADIMFGFNRPNDHHHYEVLAYLDAMGDTGQGFVNFVIFSVLQAEVRQYVKDVIRRCWDCCNHDVIDDESFTASVTPSQMSSCSSDPPRDRIED